MAMARGKENDREGGRGEGKRRGVRDGRSGREKKERRGRETEVGEEDGGEGRGRWVEE